MPPRQIVDAIPRLVAALARFLSPSIHTIWMLDAKGPFPCWLAWNITRAGAEITCEEAKDLAI